MFLSRFIAATLLVCGLCTNLHAQEYIFEQDIPYTQDTGDPYRAERCKLDLYYPAGQSGFKTFVWFHGGGLTGGEKFIPELMREKGVAIVAPNYRLSPQAGNPAYTEDAAEAVAWTLQHIAEYGGDPAQVYIGGHSAGGYLVLLLALDKSYLAPYGFDPDRLAGIFPVSGQTMTHYTIRAERGLSQQIPVVDEYAPVVHLRADTAPITLITGQSELELAARTEENLYLYELLRTAGNQGVKIHVLSGFDHGSVVWPAQELILRGMGMPGQQ